MEASNSDRVVQFFDGALRTRILNRPDVAYAFEASFRLDHRLAPKLFSQKPPMHFHPYQDEYIKVLAGRLVVDVNGKERILSPDDDQLCVRAWSHHRLYPLYKNNDITAAPETLAYVYGQKTERLFEEDVLFLENLSNYQQQIVMNGEKVDIIQIMSLFDAGGSYLSFPAWVPLGRYASQAIGVLVGRWLGGILGYQPFRQEWSTDWALACEKMETSIFQRRFSDRSKGH